MFSYLLSAHNYQVVKMVWLLVYISGTIHSLKGMLVIIAKPQVSLTVPNCNHFAQVSLTVLDNFLDAIAKPKN